MAEAKPFVKWVGGKRQLLEQLDKLLPHDFDRMSDVTYIEPFVGGGAYMFHMLQAHANITSAVINDINPDLTACYRIVRDRPSALVSSLKNIQDEYYALGNEESRRGMFLNIRTLFNRKEHDDLDNTAMFFFLNRTCFNGLYRVNKSGMFNVPFGKYKRPLICDPDTIYADSKLLQRVEVMTGDFEQTITKVNGNTFFYLDPPYRPLSDTSSFNDYSVQEFDDEEQRRLKRFCDLLDSMGVSFMLSNSDCLGKDSNDRFFDDLYQGYDINRVWASRNVNANAAKRGKLTEIVVRNRSKEEVLNII